MINNEFWRDDIKAVAEEAADAIKDMAQCIETARKRNYPYIETYIEQLDELNELNEALEKALEILGE